MVWSLGRVYGRCSFSFPWVGTGNYAFRSRLSLAFFHRFFFSCAVVSGAVEDGSALMFRLRVIACLAADPSLGVESGVLGRRIWLRWPLVESNLFVSLFCACFGTTVSFQRLKSCQEQRISSTPPEHTPRGPPIFLGPTPSLAVAPASSRRLCGETTSWVGWRCGGRNQHDAHLGTCLWAV